MVCETRRWLLLGKTFINLVKISKDSCSKSLSSNEKKCNNKETFIQQNPQKLSKNRWVMDGASSHLPQFSLRRAGHWISGSTFPASGRVLEQWMLAVSFSIALCCRPHLCGGRWVGVPAYPSPFPLGREGLCRAVVMRAGPPMPSSVLSSSCQRVVKTLLISKKLDNEQFLNS